MNKLDVALENLLESGFDDDEDEGMGASYGSRKKKRKKKIKMWKRALRSQQGIINLAKTKQYRHYYAKFLNQAKSEGVPPEHYDVFIAHHAGKIFAAKMRKNQKKIKKAAGKVKMIAGVAVGAVASYYAAPYIKKAALAGKEKAMGYYDKAQAYLKGKPELLAKANKYKKQLGPVLEKAKMIKAMAGKNSPEYAAQVSKAQSILPANSPAIKKEAVELVMRELVEQYGYAPNDPNLRAVAVAAVEEEQRGVENMIAGEGLPVKKSAAGLAIPAAIGAGLLLLG